MDIYSIKGVHIDGIVACVPGRKVENEISLRKMYGDEAKLIMESTGIRSRYLANTGTKTSDLCISCAENLLNATGTNREDIGGIVFVTFTPDRRMPFNAATVQNALGLNKGIPAFDINLACSGYGYGLYIASTLCLASQKKILLLDGDVQSTCTSPFDKATVPVLADGGSATLLSYTKEEREWKFSFFTDGAGKEVLTIPSGGTERPEQLEDLNYSEYLDGSKRRNIDIYMDGFEVFRFVAMDISKWLLGFMNEICETAQTIDSFIPHQANMYMIRKLARKLKFDWDHTWQSGDEVGNSASATVPVTIAYDVNRRIIPGRMNKVLISGFGAGLSASAGLIELDPNAYYEFFQYHREEGK